ncbi:hypothetical protein BGZ99_007648 [Dissophora globulifera]|uniref:Uncharacterized protein n=1 Tax=Dissophora globulifera TaxID=979702 RepID=A0A9P6UYD2_9FUNG|nr:hypothetical protein BGZ99_007648 [Dissophora globulifera]
MGNPSSPLTPIPTASYPELEVAAFPMDLQVGSFSAYVDQLPLLTSLSIERPRLDQHDAQETVPLVSAPRSKPRPTPIATKPPSRSSSLSLLDTARDSSLLSEDAQENVPQPQSPASSEERSADVGGRDSGIALECWDIRQSHLDATKDLDVKDDHPQESYKTASSDREQLRHTPERRQRCQSMIYSASARVVDVEGSASQLSAEDPSKTAAVATNNTTTSAVEDARPKGRVKRVSSMSFGSAHAGSKVPPVITPDLPPLPPKATAAPAPRTSFFVSPSNQDNDLDTEPRRTDHWLASSSGSSLSSSSSSSASATISLSRATSPSMSSVSTLSQGIPFSNILDLATAKAENITGLYYAKQMHRRSTSCLYSPPDPMITTQGQNMSPQPCADVPHKPVQVRIELDAASPIANHVPHLFSVDHTGVKTFSEEANVPSPARRIRTMTSAETLLPSSHSKMHPGADASPDLVASNTNSVDASTSIPPPRSTLAKGLHRRSHSASHFFHLSSLKHHSPAQFNLALCYEHGQGGVDKDLEKAIHFYQQAADQGHTKASYNIGCICYNQGELSKAMAWFESAGKCSIRGLEMEGADQGSVRAIGTDPSFKFPLPKQATLSHELEDMLLGNLTATSGSFAAYFPAILCLALLCRQGVQTRDGDVILKKDPEQSVELLEKLLHRASSQGHLDSNNSHDNVSEKGRQTQDIFQDCTSSMGVGLSSTSRGCQKLGSDDLSNLHGQPPSPSLLSTSCPSLPLGDRCRDSLRNASAVNQSFSESQPLHERIKRRPTVEDEVDEEMPQTRRPTRTPVQVPERTTTQTLPQDSNGTDDHETWSITLAQQLLRVWRDTKLTAKAASSAEASAEAERKSKRILRHHLLYIINPTLGKNLYNLGVLYDLYLGNTVIAVKCYRAAYHNSLEPAAQETAVDLGSQRHELQQQEWIQRGLVTRINSAWNLGVLLVRRKDWKHAQEWFLRAQQDILLHERQQHQQTCDGKGLDTTALSAVQQGGIGNDKQKTLDARSSKRKSLVNMLPHNQTSLSDSPGKRHAREHGLMMDLSAMAGPNALDRRKGRADEPRSGGEASGERRELPDEGIRTDANKVSWVMRWVESQMGS